MGIWQKATSLVCKRNLVDIFHHIRQVAARVTKLVLRGALGIPFSGRRGHRGSAMVPFERAMVVSYRLSIVTIALVLTIRPQFTVECLRCWNQRGQILGRKGLIDVGISQLLTQYGRDMGLSYAKVIVSIYSAVW